MLEKLFELFEKCEDIRYRDELASEEEYFPQKSSNYYKESHERFLKKIEDHEFGKTTSSGENLDAIKKYNLTIEEASIIYMYTSHFIFDRVNSSLRQAPNHLDEDVNVKEYSRLLNLALEKLPSFRNQVIYRDVNHPDYGIDEAIKYHRNRIGENIKMCDYMSSHKSESRWSDYKTGFQYKIQTSNNSRARDLKYITFVQDEEEVIFISCTTFEVQFVDETNNIIGLKELS